MQRAAPGPSWAALCTFFSAPNSIRARRRARWSMRYHRRHRPGAGRRRPGLHRIHRPRGLLPARPQPRHRHPGCRPAGHGLSHIRHRLPGRQHHIRRARHLPAGNHRLPHRGHPLAGREQREAQPDALPEGGADCPEVAPAKKGQAILIIRYLPIHLYTESSSGIFLGCSLCVLHSLLDAL